MRLLITIFLILASVGLRAEADLFAGVFADLGGVVSRAQENRRYVEVLARELGKEHPGADARQLEYVLRNVVYGKFAPYDYRRTRLDGVEVTGKNEFINNLCRAFVLFREGGDYRLVEEVLDYCDRNSAEASYSRYVTRELHYLTLREPVMATPPVSHWPCEELIGLLRDGKLPEELLPFAVRRLTEYDYDFAGMTDDDALPPWFKVMMQGQAAAQRAWRMCRDERYRLPEPLRAGFERELRRAAKAFREALVLKPEWKLPHLYLIRVEGCLGNTAQAAKEFRNWIRHQPDSAEGFDAIAAALEQRWAGKGGPQQLLNLAEAALARDDEMAVLGFNLLGKVMSDTPEYIWKTGYSRPGIIAGGDRLLSRKPDSFYESGSVELARLLFRAATQRYEVIDSKELEELIESRSHELDASTCEGPLPRVPLFDDLKMLNKELLDIEKMYLAGDRERAQTELLQMIQSGKFSGDEKSFLINRWGRYGLDAGGRYYLRAGEFRKLYSAFQVAGMTGRTDVAEGMLKLGFDYRQYEGRPGETAMLAACYGSDPAFFDLLQKQGDTLRQRINEYTPLHYAAIYGNTAMAKKLIDLGVPVNILGPSYRTPLWHAVVGQNPETVKLLAEISRDPPLGHNRTTVLLDMIHRHPPFEVYKILIENSDFIDCVDAKGRSALHYAAELSRDPRLIRALLKAGADPYLKDNEGNTPISLAISNDRDFFKFSE